VFKALLFRWLSELDLQPKHGNGTSQPAEIRIAGSAFAIVAALLVNKPSGGNVETVFTPATQRFPFFASGAAPDLDFRRTPDFASINTSGISDASIRNRESRKKLPSRN
jgi:hypothetical protein